VTKYLNGRSIQDAANWMDELRDDHSYDYLKPYHYVNFDKGAKVVNHEGDNIIFRLTQTIQELKNYKNLSDEDVKMKICIIFHLVGDLHQPLHVGFGTDKGGNTQQINYNGKGTNLHSFFDSGIINARNISLSDCLAVNTYSKHQIKRLGKINTVKWAKESRSYLPTIYDYKSNVIPETYVDTQAPIIKKQLLHAGLRLASVLTAIFG
jgi:S1/P1 Nuclease